MSEFDIAFQEYINSFKALKTSEKRMEIINSVKEISALISKWGQEEGIELQFLKSNEILDLKDGLETEDDFLEALLVYIENSKNLLGQYLSNKM